MLLDTLDYPVVALQTDIFSAFYRALYANGLNGLLTTVSLTVHFFSFLVCS